MATRALWNDEPLDLLLSETGLGEALERHERQAAAHGKRQIDFSAVPVGA